MFNMRKRSIDLRKRYVEDNYINYNKFLSYKKEVKDMTEDELALILLENEKLRTNENNELRNLNREIRNLKNELKDKEELLNSHVDMFKSFRELEDSLKLAQDNDILNKGTIEDLTYKLERKTKEVNNCELTIQSLRNDNKTLNSKYTDVLYKLTSEKKLKEREELLEKQLKILNDFNLNKRIDETRVLEAEKRKKEKEIKDRERQLNNKYLDTTPTVYHVPENNELNSRMAEMEKKLKELEVNTNKLKTDIKSNTNKKGRFGFL